MKVTIKVFIDGKECELKDLPNEYLELMEQNCKRIRLRRFFKERNKTD